MYLIIEYHDENEGGESRRSSLFTILFETYAYFSHHV